jgi:hypothetical protein
VKSRIRLALLALLAAVLIIPSSPAKATTTLDIKHYKEVTGHITFQTSPATATLPAEEKTEWIYLSAFQATWMDGIPESIGTIANDWLGSSANSVKPIYSTFLGGHLSEDKPNLDWTGSRTLHDSRRTSAFRILRKSQITSKN